MTAPLKDSGAAVDNRLMEALSSTQPATRKRTLQLPQVPVPIWVIGLTSWALAFRRIFAELLG